MSDLELLQDYSRGQSQAAFTTLVNRHLDLVYSAALRQVRSPQLAEEISQSVFLELSRVAGKFPVNQPVAAWLYVVTRRSAIDVIRRESRRLARETTALEIAAMKTPPESWSKVEARLDEAMETLNETDRTAIVLRFLENHSLRDVGATLGISDDAAQKRVSRALDQLRLFFSRRGVAVSSATLATDLSAHALQIAPAGLSASISATAGLSGVAGVVVEATKAIAMTTTQKVIAATLAVAVGAGIYEVSAFAYHASEITAQERQIAALTTQLRHTNEQQTAAADRLKSTESLIDSRLAGATSDAALESRLRGWQANLDQLRQFLQQRPNLSIPELQLLSDDDWFEAATKTKVDSDEGIRRTLADLRTRATFVMGDKIRSALNAYLRASDGTLPDRIDQLLPFFNPSIEPAWLDRYEMLRTGKLTETGKITEFAGRNRFRSEIIGTKSFGDIEYDSLIKFGPNSSSEGSAMDENWVQAIRVFPRTRDQPPPTAAQLIPYLKWPVTEAALQKFLDEKTDRARQ